MRNEASMAKGWTNFVGRQKELKTLQEALGKAQSGSGQVVGIVGEAGVGKSRLILELRNLLSEKDFTYLEGHCLHFGGDMSYLPVMDILKAFFEVKEGDPENIIRQKMENRIARLDENLKVTLAGSL